MRLGVSYPVFDGVELLEFTLRGIRSELHHVSAVYQTTSYFGKPAGADLVPTLERLRAAGLVDELVLYEPDLALKPQENELRVRALGQRLSIAAGCTHHLSADVDEMYRPEQLANAKRIIWDGGHDASGAWFDNYFKRPTWLITPSQKHRMPFIHRVPAEYSFNAPFAFRSDPTRMATPCDSFRMLSRDELVVHHMSYVRRDMREKVLSNNNWVKGWIMGGPERFIEAFDRYRLGDRLAVPPDFRFRRTVEVPNIFGVEI